MKKRVAILSISMIAIVIVAICGMLWVYNRDNGDKPREVVLELVNPTTGEIVKNGDTIDLPENKTRIQVRVKDKETGECLTDDDLPENTVKGSYNLTFFALSEDGATIKSWNPYGYWPTKEVLEEWPTVQAVVYKVRISFDCRPDNPKDPEKFKRKYEWKTEYVRFCINKSWREEDNI